MAAPLLALQDVRVQGDRRPILDVPALGVRAGEVLAVIGPNGAGKSTLLRVMGLLQRPTQGSVWFHGERVLPGHALAIRRRMASVFQDALLLNASVYDNAALGLKLRGLDRRRIAQRLHPWLERLGIAHLSRRPARGLSGGEAQRTSLVRALALEPDLLLLDEPFAALDPPSREALLLDLEPILRETGITTVFVTHERQEALTLGDRVAVLFDGHVVQEGVPWYVFSHPVSEAVARFVGAEINLSGTVRTCCRGMAQIETPLGRLEAPAELASGTDVTLCLRPEDLTVSPATQPLPRSSARNAVRGTLQKITPWGGQARVLIDCGVDLTALVTRRSVEELALQAGLTVWVTFKASAVHVIPHHGRASGDTPP